MSEQAYWYYDPNDEFEVDLLCSRCGKDQIHSDDGGGVNCKTPFCPWCGAEMGNSEFKKRSERPMKQG